MENNKSLHQLFLDQSLYVSKWNWKILGIVDSRNVQETTTFDSLFKEYVDGSFKQGKDRRLIFMKETGPNLIKKKLLLFLLTRGSLLKIDDLNADNSTNIYLD